MSQECIGFMHFDISTLHVYYTAAMVYAPIAATLGDVNTNHKTGNLIHKNLLFSSVE